MARWGGWECKCASVWARARVWLEIFQSRMTKYTTLRKYIFTPNTRSSNRKHFVDFSNNKVELLFRTVDSLNVKWLQNQIRIKLFYYLCWIERLTKIWEEFKQKEDPDGSSVAYDWFLLFPFTLWTSAVWFPLLNHDFTYFVESHPLSGRPRSCDILIKPDMLLMLRMFLYEVQIEFIRLNALSASAEMTAVVFIIFLPFLIVDGILSQTSIKFLKLFTLVLS